MAIEELNEESTTEQINEYVEELAAVSEAEREEQDKDDSQIISEHTNNEHRENTKVVEAKSDDDSEAGESDEESSDWFDDDVKAEIAAYGIDESDIKDFANREELDRALRLLDRNAVEDGRRAIEGSDDDEEEETEEPDEGTYAPLDPDVYDDEIVRNDSAFNTRLAALESLLIHRDALDKERQFDAVIDEMGHGKLFGKTGEETAKQLKNRENVYIAVNAQLNARGGGDMSHWVKVLSQGLFAEEFGKKTIQNHTRKISRQSNGRQGGGVTRASDPREDPADEFERLYKEMSGN